MATAFTTPLARAQPGQRPPSAWRLGPPANAQSASFVKAGVEAAPLRRKARPKVVSTHQLGLAAGAEKEGVARRLRAPLSWLAGASVAAGVRRGRCRSGQRQGPAELTETRDLAEAIDRLPLTRQHFLAYFCAGMANFGLGGLNDPIGVAFPSFQAEWGPLPPGPLALAASAGTAGQIAAAGFSGSLGDRFGRRAVARWGTLVGLASVLLCASAPSLRVVAVGRFVGGLGFGANLVVLPTLLSEVMPSRYPRLLVTYQACWPLAACLFVMALELCGWRAGVALSAPFMLALAAVLFLPGGLVESPRSSLARGRLDEAADAWSRLGGRGPLPREASSPDSDGGSAAESAGSGTGLESGLYGLFLLGFLCHGAASQLVKVWLPTALSQLGTLDGAGSAVFAAMWAMESLSIIGLGIALGGAGRSGAGSGSGALLGQVRVSMASFFVAGLAVVGNLAFRIPAAASGLGSVHLMSQAAAWNFLMPFAASCLPVASRARLVSGLLVANYGGVLLSPSLGSLLLLCMPPVLGATALLCLATAIYGIGAISVLRVLQLQRQP